eukprot:352948-Chlamydomonas_euryale.AAC.1
MRRGRRLPSWCKDLGPGALSPRQPIQVDVPAVTLVRGTSRGASCSASPARSRLLYGAAALPGSHNSMLGASPRQYASGHGGDGDRAADGAHEGTEGAVPAADGSYEYGSCGSLHWASPWQHVHGSGDGDGAADDSALSPPPAVQPEGAEMGVAPAADDVANTREGNASLPGRAAAPEPAPVSARRRGGSFTGVEALGGSFTGVEALGVCTGGGAPTTKSAHGSGPVPGSAERASTATLVTWPHSGQQWAAGAHRSPTLPATTQHGGQPVTSLRGGQPAASPPGVPPGCGELSARTAAARSASLPTGFASSAFPSAALASAAWTPAPA